MNDDSKVQDVGAADKAKSVAAIVLVLAGIAGYYVLGDQAAYLRWLAVAAGLALGIAVFAWSQYGRDFYQFMLDSRVELRKIVWPGREETLKLTAVVFIFVVLAGVFFWVLDLGLAWVTRQLTGQGS